jgi:aminomethyltransferase
MLRPTPLHGRTTSACRSWLFRDWNGHVAVRRFGGSVDDEVRHIGHRAGLLDLSPPTRLDVAGADAARLLSRVCTRNVEGMTADRVAATLLLDEQGLLLDDGTVAHLGNGAYRLTTDGHWLGWLLRHARGLDVRIEDVTERTAVLGVEGPLAIAIVGRLAPSAVHMERHALREVEIGGRRALVARAAVGPDGGFQITVDASEAPRLWDALLDGGHGHGLQPVGIDALDVLRIEAGHVRRGADYVSGRSGPSRRTATPHALDLAGHVDLERGVPFVGQERVEQEARHGAVTALAGLEVDEEDHARLSGRDVLLEPPEDGITAAGPVAVYDADGASVVGFAGSCAWSPNIRRTIALARIPRDLAEPGRALRLEQSIDAERRSVAATVVPLPFRSRAAP